MRIKTQLQKFQLHAQVVDFVLPGQKPGDQVTDIEQKPGQQKDKKCGGQKLRADRSFDKGFRKEKKDFSSQEIGKRCGNRIITVNVAVLTIDLKQFFCFSIRDGRRKARAY